jgi:hypothetical protein
MKITVITTYQLYFTVLTVSSEITPKSEELYSVCQFLRSALPCVALYCARGGVKVVSMSPSYPCNTVVPVLFFGVRIEHVVPHAIVDK